MCQGEDVNEDVNIIPSHSEVPAPFHDSFLSRQKILRRYYTFCRSVTHCANAGLNP